MQTKPNNRRAKWALIALAALFLAGVGGAWLMYVMNWHPQSTKNYGELVQPARPLTDAKLQDLTGQPVTLSALRGRWTLVYFGSAECLKVCTDNLHKMRQLVLAQGRDAHRLRRLFVVTDARALDVLRYTLADYAGTEAWTAPAATVREVAQQFAVPAGSPMDNLHRIYVVDPLGNFMMSYPADADLRRMNKDIGVLLRTSQVG